MGTILLTGITGNIGSELARLLANEPIPLRALSRDRQRVGQVLGEGLAARIDIVEGDYTDESSLERAMRGIETVFLVSPDPGLEPTVVAAARRAKVKRIVKSSAIGFKAEPPEGHKAVEALIAGSGIGFTFLRPNAFMQTLSAYLPRLIDQEGYFFLPAGDGRTAWIDARDIAAVAARVLTQAGHEGKMYQLTGPAALTMTELAAVLSRHAGKQVQYQPAPVEVARQKARERGLGRMADFLVMHYQAVQAGGFEQVTAAVAEITGREARSFEQFVSENKAVWH